MHRSSHAPCIHSRNRCRRSNQCADPSNPSASGSIRCRSPTRVASKAHLHTGPAPTLQGPNNSRRLHNSNSRASKHSRHRVREVGCNWEAVVEVPRLLPAVHKRRFGRKFARNQGNCSSHWEEVHNPAKGVYRSAAPLTRPAPASGSRTAQPRPDCHWQGHRW